MYRLKAAWFLIAAMMLCTTLCAERVSVALGPAVELDEAGRGLRMAINAFEQALASPLPDAWSRVALSERESLSLGAGNFLLVLAAAKQETTIMFVDEDGPHQARLAAGTQMELGSIEAILVSTRDGGPVELLLRKQERVPLLLPTKAGVKSATRISGVPTPPEIIVETASPKIAEFAVAFLDEYNRTRDSVAAASAARDAVPVTLDSVPTSERRPVRAEYADPVNMFEPRQTDQPIAALVTLHLVRGEDTALRALSGRYEYRSDGRAANDPNVRVSGGGDGLDVGIGRARDRFQGRLQALESEGQAHSESETFVRVPLGGESLLRLGGPSGHMEAWIAARPAGRAVQLEIDQRSGDWSFLGGVSTTVRVRDGETVTQARNTSTRVSSSRSGPPVITGIPYLGPLTGTTTEQREGQTYALYATVELE